MKSRSTALRCHLLGYNTYLLKCIDGEMVKEEFKSSVIKIGLTKNFLSNTPATKRPILFYLGGSTTKCFYKKV